MQVIFLELILVLGAVLGLGIWQLLDVNKALKDDENPAATDQSGDADRNQR